jgi:hypothetical protein
VAAGQKKKGKPKLQQKIHHENGLCNAGFGIGSLPPEEVLKQPSLCFTSFMEEYPSCSRSILTKMIAREPAHLIFLFS